MQKFTKPTEGGHSCIQGQISSWGCRVHCAMSCLGWLARSRKSAQGTKNPFHIAHHPMLLAALRFTGQSSRELIGMSSEFQRWQLYSSWHLFSSQKNPWLGERSRGVEEVNQLLQIRSCCFYSWLSPIPFELTVTTAASLFHLSWHLGRI